MIRRVRELGYLPVIGAIWITVGCESSTIVDAPGDRPSLVLAPQFNPNYTGPGYDIGVTDYDCITNLADDYDNDGFSDACENALALVFQPRLRLHNDEDFSREPVYAVRRSQLGYVTIAYLLAYHRDYGSDYGPLSSIVWGPHSGDSEFIFLHVAEENGIWLLQSAFFSAHWRSGGVKTGPITWIKTDHSALHDHSELSYADNDRGRPNVWVSWGKHANYKSFQACNDHFFDSCHHGNVYWYDALVYPGLERNIGSYGTRLIDCIGSLTPSYYQGTECFWTDTSRFNGWYTGTWGKRATAYSRILRQFGFTADPPAPTPTVTINGQQQVHPNANCNWWANVSGGTFPFTFEWYRGETLVSTSASYSTNTGSQSFYLTVVVSDKYDFTHDYTILVDVSTAYSYCDEFME